MPLTPKGMRLKSALIKRYGKREGTRIFYAAERSGRFRGVRKRKKKRM